jgi:sensor histidine kinase regulating citrate/malate metabolism
VGRRSFTREEVDELRRLIREKQTADSSRQKVLRARMRRMEFYISDFAADPGGFVVSDLDELISRGTIEVVESGAAEEEATDGSGLGLTIVASIASIHGGTATADPRKDGGLSVTVRIPSLAARS